MALNPESLGKSFPSRTTYLVGREKVREFARSVGEESELCFDSAAAQAAGYADVVAPVTFPIVITLELMGGVATDPSVGLDWSRVVHAEQRFHFDRPVVAGDELSAVTTIEEIKSLAGNDIITLRGDLSDAAGSPVAQVWTTLLARAEA